MTKEEAEKIFTAYLKNECPECKTPAGELCNTVGVWVHLERMLIVQKDWNSVELLRYALNLRMHGEDPTTGSWRDWESKCELYLRGLA